MAIPEKFFKPSQDEYCLHIPPAAVDHLSERDRDCWPIWEQVPYRVTYHVGPNLLLTWKQKFHFNLCSSYLNANFVSMSTWRFGSTWCVTVTLYHSSCVHDRPTSHASQSTRGWPLSASLSDHPDELLAEEGREGTPLHYREYCTNYLSALPR